MQNWGKRVIFIVGFLLCLFPLVSNVITRWQQEQAIGTYQTAVEYNMKSNLKEIVEI